MKSVQTLGKVYNSLVKTPFSAIHHTRNILQVVWNDQNSCTQVTNHELHFRRNFAGLQSGAEEVVDMRGGWADPDLVSGLVW